MRHSVGKQGLVVRGKENREKWIQNRGRRNKSSLKSAFSKPRKPENWKIRYFFNKPLSFSEKDAIIETDFNIRRF